MKTDRNDQDRRRNRPRYDRAGRFAEAATPPANFRATEPNEFERLKDELLQVQLAGENDLDLLTALRRAANDAAALAWTMPFPALVFPELFHEKVAAARRYSTRQATLRQPEAVRPARDASEVAA